MTPPPRHMAGLEGVVEGAADQLERPVHRGAAGARADVRQHRPPVVGGRCVVVPGVRRRLRRDEAVAGAAVGVGDEGAAPALRPRGTGGSAPP